MKSAHVTMKEAAVMEFVATRMFKAPRDLVLIPFLMKQQVLPMSPFSQTCQLWLPFDAFK